jgi:hypothetical protein
MARHCLHSRLSDKVGPVGMLNLLTCAAVPACVEEGAIGIVEGKRTSRSRALSSDGPSCRIQLDGSRERHTTG